MKPKNIVANTVEVDDAEEEALDAKLEAAFKRQGTISSTAAVAVAKGKVDSGKNTAKFSSILGSISL